MEDLIDTRGITADRLYLGLLKKCLTRYVFGEPYRPVWYPKGSPRNVI